MDPDEMGEVETFDYYDPDEEPVTDSPEGEEQADFNPDEQPPEGEPEQDQDDTAEGEEPEATDDPTVEIDGEHIPVSQLREERMRQQDYSRKTAELARERDTVQQERQVYSEQVQRVQSLLHETEQFLTGLIPEKPSWDLMNANPGEYQRQEALRAEIMQMVSDVQVRGQQVQQSQQGINEHDQRQRLQRDVDGLHTAFPALKGDNQKLAKFVADKRADAAEFGFSPQEVGQVTDHRLLTMAHYAALGKKAEHNRNNAKRRLEAPKRGGPRPAQSQAQPGVVKNRKAMQRLEKSGSLRDALNVDFE